MINLTLPIYYTDKKGTHLLSLNKYERLHYHALNKIKKEYYLLVRSQIDARCVIRGKYTASFKLFYKNAKCDAPNIISVIDKLVMDGLQVHGILQQDNVNYYVSSSWEVMEKDAENARIEIEIKELSE